MIINISASSESLCQFMKASNIKHDSRWLLFKSYDSHVLELKGLIGNFYFENNIIWKVKGIIFTLKTMKENMINF